MRLDTERDHLGVDTVQVLITDGTHPMTVRWLVQIIPYRYPKILFDEAHGERNTMVEARASLF